MQQQPPQQPAPTSQHHGARIPHHQPQQPNPHAYHVQMAHMHAHLNQQYLYHEAAAAAASGGNHESAAAAAQQATD